MSVTSGPEAFARLAEEIAREAGAMLLDKRSARPEVVQTKSSPTDVVTAFDRAAEDLIRARVRAARPQDAILGEEGGATYGTPTTSGAEGSGAHHGDAAGSPGSVRWVVDPIDGTVNFMYGLPEWAVSVAVEVDGRIVAGVVNVVPRREVFTAWLGGGAWLAGERLRCNTGVPLASALVGTGFGYQPGRRAVQAEVLAGVLPRVRDVRRAGSCAADLCSVAAGRLDAYYERGPQYWDFAAGGLIAAEAGAVVGGLGGRPYSTDMTVCAAPGLFEELHDLLVTLNPERDA